MPTFKIERLLNEIGQLLAEDAHYPLDGTFSTLSWTRHFVAPSICKDVGDHVSLYREPRPRSARRCTPRSLGRPEMLRKRWRTSWYVIHDGSFHINVYLPRQIDPQEERWDRRDRAVARHFGNKPIVSSHLMPDDRGTVRSSIDKRGREAHAVSLSNKQTASSRWPGQLCWWIGIRRCDRQRRPSQGGADVVEEPDHLDYIDPGMVAPAYRYGRGRRRWRLTPALSSTPARTAADLDRLARDDVECLKPGRSTMSGSITPPLLAPREVTRSLA